MNAEEDVSVNGNESSAWPDHPRLVGTTGDKYNESLSSTAAPAVREPNNFFKNVLWSPDGTTLLTSNADDTLKTFILPPDLLDGTKPHMLEPYHSQQLPGSTYATALYPSYSLSDTSMALYLASPSQLPIRLLSPYSDTILATYPWISPATEAYVAPHSLLFDTYSSHAGSHFFAGGDSEISLFDLHRPGEGPHTTLKTIPSKRKKIVGGGVGMKGIVSTLGCSPDGILAAGTFTRWLGLYDGGGRGGDVGVFQLGRGSEAGHDGTGEGAGITQVAWAGDGRYLLVAERKSDGIGVWDIRGTGKRLAWLRGRNCLTMQRMGFDIINDMVVAGGTDGFLRMWNHIGQKEGNVDPAWSVKAHDDAISGVVFHPTAAVFATCSGQRHFQGMPKEGVEAEYPNDFMGESRTESESESESDSESAGNTESGSNAEEDSISGQTLDSSLRIWSLYSELSQEE